MQRKSMDMCILPVYKQWLQSLKFDIVFFFLVSLKVNLIIFWRDRRKDKHSNPTRVPLFHTDVLNSIYMTELTVALDYVRVYIGKQKYVVYITIK